MTSKQRAYLKSLAVHVDALFQMGKSNLTPEFTNAIDEAFGTRELIKVTVLKSCEENPKEAGEMLAQRTRAEIVQVIGRKIVLYRENRDESYAGKKIILP